MTSRRLSMAPLACPSFHGAPRAPDGSDPARSGGRGSRSLQHRSIRLGARPCSRAPAYQGRAPLALPRAASRAAGWPGPCNLGQLLAASRINTAQEHCPRARVIALRHPDTHLCNSAASSSFRNEASRIRENQAERPRGSRGAPRRRQERIHGLPRPPAGSRCATCSGVRWPGPPRWSWPTLPPQRRSVRWGAKFRPWDGCSLAVSLLGEHSPDRGGSSSLLRPATRAAPTVLPLPGEMDMHIPTPRARTPCHTIFRGSVLAPWEGASSWKHPR